MLPSVSAHCVCIVVLHMSLCQCSFVCGCHFNLLRMFYVLLFRTSQKDVGWERRGKWQAITMASRRYHQERKRIKQEYLAVPVGVWLIYCCLLPTCYFHWPFTQHWFILFPVSVMIKEKRAPLKQHCVFYRCLMNTKLHGKSAAVAKLQLH